MKPEKILLLIGIALLVYAFLIQPPSPNAPEWQQKISLSGDRPGQLRMLATSIMPENINSITLYITKAEVLNSDNEWKEVLSGTMKLDLGHITTDGAVLGMVKLEPGKYSKIKIEIMGAESTDSTGRITQLRIEDTDRFKEVSYNMNVEPDKVTSVTLIIDAKSSIDRFYFRPVIRAQ